MKVVIFDDELHYRDNTGKYYSKFTWSKFAVDLGRSFGEFRVLLPVKKYTNNKLPECSWLDDKYVVKITPGWGSIVESIIKLPLIMLWIARNYNLLKGPYIVILRLPSIIGFILYFVIKKINPSAKIVIYIGGNILTQANPLRSSNPIIKNLTSIASKLIHRITLKIVVNNLTFTTGYELYKLYKIRESQKIYPVVSAMLSKKDMFLRKDTCQGDEIIIIRVCQLLPSKGLEYLIEAVSYLSKEEKNKQFKLHIIGEGSLEYKQKLENFIQNLGLKNVFLLGHLSWDKELKDLYKKSDIMVVSSVAEGFPRVIVEAWAFGIPVVATRVGGIPEYVIHKKNGLIVEAANSRSLFKGIKEMATNKILRQQCILGGYKSFEEQFSQEKIFSFIKGKIENENR